MKKLILTVSIAMLAVCLPASAQVKRTLTKSDRFNFGPGGTVAITGAPQGSIKIVGGQTNEIEITATIELSAPTESDIAKLSEITGFVTEEGVAKTAILSLGTHAKQILKRSKKKIPKELMDLPFRIDYVVSVPHYTDLEIDGGVGDLTVENVEGSLFVNFIETNAKLGISSGNAAVTVQRGSIVASLGPKVWRGRAASLSLGTGDISVHLPSTLSADLDVVVLRSGKIENSFPDLKPRDRKVAFTDRSIIAKAGVGGPPVKLGVGDGNIKIDVLTKP
jgi:hypothetical protein